MQSAAAVQWSIEWLREAFQLANDVVAAEHAEEKDGTKGLDILPDPRINALTQIFNEFAPADSPELMGLVVHEVDKVVTQDMRSAAPIAKTSTQLRRRPGG